MRRGRSMRTPAALVLCTLAHVANAMVGSTIANHRVALPALRLGGEWAGTSAAYSSASGALVRPGVESLVSERWNADRRMERTAVQFHPHGATSQQDVLPLGQSGSEVLSRGARMLEPEVLNIRAWAFDAPDESTPGLWRCETLFDGLCGDRPAERPGALECPKVRTRVQCSFDPETGTFAPSSPVVVWHERCWSVSPEGDDAREPGDVDREWLAAVVGLDSFQQLGGAAGDADDGGGGRAAEAISLGCGIELRGAPGVLELALSSGEGARNGYERIVVQRSWVGEQMGAGCSIFTEVEVVEDTTGDD